MDTLLEEAIEAWEDARNGVIAEVENLPANRFDFRPTPDVRSSLRGDLYVNLMAFESSGANATVKVIVEPLPNPGVARLAWRLAALATKRLATRTTAVLVMTA